MARNWNTTHRWLSTRCGYRYLPTPSKKCKHCTIWDLWILLQSLELDAIEKITGYRIHRHLVIMMRTALGGNCGKLLQLCVLATLECLRIVYGSHVGLDIPCRSSLKVEAHWVLAYHIWQSHWSWKCLVEAHWSVYGSHVGLDIPRRSSLKGWPSHVGPGYISCMYWRSADRLCQSRWPWIGLVEAHWRVGVL